MLHYVRRKKTILRKKIILRIESLKYITRNVANIMTSI